jgi:cbb3-type cytochrome oxidase maturation protein
MDILFLILPLSMLVVVIILIIVVWAVRSGQYDDLDKDGKIILDEDS